MTCDNLFLMAFTVFPVSGKLLLRSWWLSCVVFSVHKKLRSLVPVGCTVYTAVFSLPEELRFLVPDGCTVYTGTIVFLYLKNCAPLFLMAVDSVYNSVLFTWRTSLPCSWWLYSVHNSVLFTWRTSLPCSWWRTLSTRQLWRGGSPVGLGTGGCNASWT